MKAKVIKAYAIELKADEAMGKTEKLKELMDKTGSLGVHPMYPFAYALYRTRDEQVQAFKEFNKVFEYCKIVANIAYIPDSEPKATEKWNKRVENEQQAD